MLKLLMENLVISIYNYTRRILNLQKEYAEAN